MDKPNPLKINQINRYEVTHTSVTSFLFGNFILKASVKEYNKTIVNPDGDDSNRGQNAFFYDAAEGLLTSAILMLAEFLPPDKEHPQERRHIVSVFKLVQDLLEPSKVKGKSHFQLLMGKLPPDHLRRTRAQLDRTEKHSRSFSLSCCASASSCTTLKSV